MNVPTFPRVSGLRQIRRALLGAYALIALLYAVAVFGFLANQRAVDSLCTLRTDLQTRVDAGNQFLADHPRGIPGIPAKQFRTSLDNQQRTVSALSGLSCPAPRK